LSCLEKCFTSRAHLATLVKFAVEAVDEVREALTSAFR
jgi:hypothetical protein